MLDELAHEWAGLVTIAKIDVERNRTAALGFGETTDEDRSSVRPHA